MGMFRSAGGEGRRPPTVANDNDATLSIIAAGVRLMGEIDAEGTVRIEGTVEGNVWADKVWVAQGGIVEGDILAKESLLGGEVRGMVSAEHRVEVQASSIITGDITTPALKVHEGGQIDGKIRMAKPTIVKPSLKKPEMVKTDDSGTGEEGNSDSPQPSRGKLKAVDGGKDAVDAKNAEKDGKKAVTA